MTFAEFFFDKMGKAYLPKKIRLGLHQYFMKAGIEKVPYRLFGVLFHLSWMITLFGYFLFFYQRISDEGPVTFFLVTFVLWVMLQTLTLVTFFSLFYLYIDLRIFERTKEMERILPEFLRYVAEDLKAGLPFDKALWQAIKPEFGVLASEISLVAKRAMTGQDVDEALKSFIEKYDSPMLRRSFSLIIEAINSGSRIADTMVKIEEQLRETKDLKREMVATNTTYIFFISFIVLGVAPGLFGLSYSLLTILSSVAQKLQQTTAQASSLPLQISGVNIDPNQFVTFSLLALVVISVFASMIMSQIKRGNIKGGIKYIPFFTVASLGMYLMFKALFAFFFGGLV
ncbi:type II secretion system F family protein [Candidatus Woesearchaeota archaeon]|nr:type II secretion system F family protein [Candidatus Woesearchaeota archaeon]